MKKRSDNTIKYLIIGVILVSMLFYLSQSDFLGFVTIKIPTPVYKTDFSSEKPVSITNPDSLTQYKTWGLTNLAEIGDIGNIKDVLKTTYIGKAALKVSVDNLRTYDIKMDASRLGGLYDAKVDVVFFNKNGKKLSTVPKTFTLSNQGKKDIFFNIDPPLASTSMNVILSNVGQNSFQNSFNWFVQWDNFEITEIRTAQTSCKDTDVTNDIYDDGLVWGVNNKGKDYEIKDSCSTVSGKDYVTQWKCSGDNAVKVKSNPQLCVNGCDKASGVCKKALPVVCGDGKKEGNEQCDDGNKINGDGCSATCVIEVQNLCGNNVCDTGETKTNCPSDCLGIMVEDNIVGFNFLKSIVNTNPCSLRQLGFDLGDDCNSYKASYNFNNVLYDADVEVHKTAFTNDAFIAAVEKMKDGGFVVEALNSDANIIYKLTQGVKAYNLWYSKNNVVWIPNDADLLKAYLTKYPSELKILGACIDSDNGIKIFKKGFVTGPNSGGNAVVMYDRCLEQGSDAGKLEEAYCDNGKVVSSIIPLDPECTACVYDALDDPKVSNEVDVAVCVSDTFAKDNCFDYDGGNNVFKRGYVFPKNELYGKFDVCTETNTLTEYTCSANGDSQSDQVACQNGCKDGACVKSTILIEEDIEEDINSLKYQSSEVMPEFKPENCELGEIGLTLAGGCAAYRASYLDVLMAKYYAIVENHDTVFTNDEFITAAKNFKNVLISKGDIKTVDVESKGGQTVLVFRSDKNIAFLWYSEKSVLFVSRDGVVEGVDVAIDFLTDAYLVKYPSDLMVSCSDSDNGKNYYEAGAVNFFDVIKADACLDKDFLGIASTIREYSCSSNGPESTTYACEYGCATDSNGEYVGECNGDGTLLSCTDSDNGLNYNTYGEVTAGVFSKSDSCSLNGNMLFEWVCKDNQFEFEDRSCKCEDGKCIGTLTDNVMIEDDIGGNIKFKTVYSDKNVNCPLTLNLPNGKCDSYSASYLKDQKIYGVGILDTKIQFTNEEFINAIDDFEKMQNKEIRTIGNNKVYFESTTDSDPYILMWYNHDKIVVVYGDDDVDLNSVATAYLEKYPSELVATESLELQVDVYNGWNLIFGLEHSTQVGTDEIKSENIKAIYALLPSQEYARLYPTIENDKLNNIDKSKLKNGAFWVYTNKAGKMTYKISKKGLMPFNKRSMHKKWNFVGVSPDILELNAKIKHLAGNCAIEKAYYFDPQTQGWVVISLDDPYSKLLEVKGYNAVLKMADNCQMGNLPPGLPTE